MKMKLVFLLRCTSGPARMSCVYIHGRKIWIPKILERRFGNVHLVPNQIKSKLFLESAFDMRNLVDEAENVYFFLKRSMLYAELDTQHIISSTINRSSLHHMSRWRNAAVSTEGKVGAYTSFEHFVEFLWSISNKSTFPLYGYQQIYVKRTKETSWIIIIALLAPVKICYHLPDNVPLVI